MTFHVINCIKTCQREQVNKFLQHVFHSKFRMINSSEKLYFAILRGGGKLEQSPFLSIVILRIVMGREGLW